MSKLSDAADSMLIHALKARDELCKKTPGQEAEYLDGLELVMIVVDSRIGRCCAVHSQNSKASSESSDLVNTYRVVTKALTEYVRELGAREGKRFLNDFLQNES